MALTETSSSHKLQKKVAFRAQKHNRKQRTILDLTEPLLPQRQPSQLPASPTWPGWQPPHTSCPPTCLPRPLLTRHANSPRPGARQTVMEVRKGPQTSCMIQWQTRWAKEASRPHQDSLPPQKLLQAVVSTPRHLGRQSSDTGLGSLSQQLRGAVCIHVSLKFPQGRRPPAMEQIPLAKKVLSDQPWK